MVVGDKKFDVVSYVIVEGSEDKRHDIRFTKQISVTRMSNLPSKFHFPSNVLLIF
jgi:hypothetical protein